jgi:penicillin-binding protein 1C
MRLSALSSWMKRRRAIACAVAAAVLIPVVGALVVVVRAPTPPQFQAVVAAYRTSEARLLDRRGRLLHTLRVDDGRRRLDWTPLANISPALPKAVIATEDRRFYQHHGVDWTAVASATFSNLSGHDTRGASTITMQLASLLHPDSRPRKGKRSVTQKVRQMAEAMALERRWSKSQILEAYLNLVSYRGEIQGVSAAAMALFQKAPHGLDSSDAALLAALLRSPNAGVEQVVARAEALAGEVGSPSDNQAVRAKAAKALGGAPHIPPEADLAPHVAWKLLGKARQAGKPAELRCTLDLDLQAYATEALRNRLASLRSRNVGDGAVIVLDNASGDILVYLGNDGQRTTARYVDGAVARRQAGSILKPFLYGVAFEQKLLTPASLLDDSPLDLPVMGGVYRPQNYDSQFHGLVTARQALASSLNVPAVRTLGLVGVDPFLATLVKLGFHDLQRSDYYGPSLALGSADVCLVDLADAYRALANQGVYAASRLTPDAPEGAPRRVLSAQAAYLVSDILSDRESREITFGLESPLVTRFWTAVKTGTSKDMRDNWCVGYSERYTVAVWVGNFSGAPMWNVSGMSGAAPLWLDLMNYLHRDLPSRQPDPPPGLRSRETSFPDLGVRRREWFLPGTETREVEAVGLSVRTHIVYPVNGTIVALDPDIPSDRQALFFEAEPADCQVRWTLDGKPLDDRGSTVRWSPAPGKHHVAIVSGDAKVADSVAFEVRGVSTPPAAE